MKRVLITILLGLCMTACLIAGKGSAAIIVNTCTSTYTAINYPETWISSGWDTVAITTETAPMIMVTKYVKNLRTGMEDNNMVPALAGDTIEFRIAWQNGGGPADTVALTDYIPPFMVYANYVWDTETNVDTPGTATYVSAENKIYYVVNGVHGITPGPAGYGEIRFRAVVNP